MDNEDRYEKANRLINNLDAILSASKPQGERIEAASELIRKYRLTGEVFISPAIIKA